MTLGFAVTACENDGMGPHAHACPCCGHSTLGERAGFEICPVCFWEDDGQDDVDAHEELGGPNRGTLWEARANFLKFGACEEAARRHVRPPAADEPSVRRWSLLDEVAVELVPSSDAVPWNLLRNGVVTDVVRDRARATLVVNIPYLRVRFAQPGSRFRVEFLDCSLLEYAPYEGAVSSLASEIAQAHPNLLKAIRERDNIVVWGSAGALRLRYEHLAVRFDDGAPLAVAALDECARAYWEERDRDFRQPALANKGDPQ
jgi:hypothetical protein